MKKLKLLATLALAMVIFIAGCKKDEYQEKIGVCPLVVSTVPADKANNVPLNQIVSATFNEKMNPATFTQTSFTLEKGTTPIAGTVSYTALSAAFAPANQLEPFTTYTGRIKTSVKDLMNNSLQTDYVWTFTTIPFVVSASLPVAGGTTNGMGPFNQGSLVTLTATPNAGYSFLNWTENGTIVSTSSNYQLTMAGNKTLVANFTLNLVLTLSSSPSIGGTTTGAGSYTPGASTTVTATPNTGYTFVNWTEGTNIVSTVATYTSPINVSRTLVANFVTSGFALNVTAINGTVVKNPVLASYSSGAIVQLTATPATGYTFTGWSGDATGSLNPVSVTMNSNKNVTANFTAIAAGTFTLNVTAVNGTVLKVPSKTAYDNGDIVVLTATPALGYTFTGWTGDATGSLNPLSVTMNSNKNITANFALTGGGFTLNVNANNGSVLKNPTMASYTSGASVVLTATPNSGYKFTSWSGDATGSVSPLTVIMNSNKNITANFIEDVIIPVGPVVNLKTAGDFSILTKSGISSTGITSVQGDIGVSPAAASAITGFGLIMDTNGQSAHTTIATHVTGKVYASDYAPPTPSKLTVAVQDMETAYTTANNLVTPAPVLEQGAGNLSGLTLAPGLYKWSTGVLIDPSASVTLSGGANDTWVFQIAQDLTLLSSAKVNLIGGAQAKNITWVVAGQAVLGTNTVLYGTILSKTLISLNSGSKVTGKLLAQTAVTLNASTVVAP